LCSVTVFDQISTFHEKNRERYTETLLLTTCGYSRLHTNMPQNTTEDNYEKELDYA
jgi:hypothetical protein